MSYFSPHLDKYLLRATLIITVPGQEMTEDELGNLVPSSTESEIICYLKEASDSKDDRKDDRRGATGGSRIYMRGYMVEPQMWPVGVVLPRDFPAMMNGRKGIFHALPHQEQPWENRYTGVKIQGWWQDQ